jgi:putative transcriptional regulator
LTYNLIVFTIIETPTFTRLWPDYRKKSGRRSMAKMGEKAVLERDAKRNVGVNLLRAVRDMKAGRAGHVHRVPMSAVTEARTRAGFSQQQFAALLGVSARTLQEWEQGRRHPSGAAQTLLAIAARHPEVLRDIVAP